VHTAKQKNGQALDRRQFVPGSGQLVSLVLLYEMHDNTRCPRVQVVVSYCRLGNAVREAAGRQNNIAGSQMGKAYAAQALCEAAVLCLRNHPAGPK
jgi:hypothetical protein